MHTICSPRDAEPLSTWAQWLQAGLQLAGRDAMRVVEVVTRMAERRRQRRALLRLDDATLKDIGLSRADAWREAGKPVWKD